MLLGFEFSEKHISIGLIISFLSQIQILFTTDIWNNFAELANWMKTELFFIEFRKYFILIMHLFFSFGSLV